MHQVRIWHAGPGHIGANCSACRCPTECRLSYSSEPWKCVVSLNVLTDRDGKPLGHPKHEQFGEIIFDKDEVEDRIRCAQRAILNPSTDPKRFLDDEDDMPGVLRELTFSINTVSLQISGPDVQDLSFCDLPGAESDLASLFGVVRLCSHSILFDIGLIASVGTNGNESESAISIS